VAFSSHLVVTTYPMPIAVGYQRFCRQADAVSRLRELYGMIEIILRYLVTLGISDLFHCQSNLLAERPPDGAIAMPSRRPRLPDDLDELRHPHAEDRDQPRARPLDFLRRPEKMVLGKWLSALRTIAKALADERQRFVRELPAVCDPKGKLLKEILTVLVEERNENWAHRHGGVPIPTQKCPAEVERLRPFLEAALQAIEFVRHYPLGFAEEGLEERDLEHEGKSYRPYRFYSCMGTQIANTGEAFVTRTDPLKLNEHLPFIIDEDSTRLLYLWPVLRERALETGRHMLYTFEMIPDPPRWGCLTFVKYFDVESGEVPWDDELNPAGTADNHHWLFEKLRELPPVQIWPQHLPKIAAKLQNSRNDQLEKQFLGRFRLDTRWAEGGFGTIYRATDPDGKIVAVKVIRSADAPRLYARFKQESEKLKAAEHPNIIKCIDSDTTTIDSRQYPWYAMDFADGGDLIDRLEERKRQTPSDRLPWHDTRLRRQIVEDFQVIAGAVAHLHDLGIVHRDIKPGNVLIMDHQLRLSDFGLVKVMKPTRSEQSHAPRTSGGGRIGTVGYMAPEQEKGLGVDVGPPSDVYSLGILLFEMALGELPSTNTTVPEGSTIRRFLTSRQSEPAELDLTGAEVGKRPSKGPPPGLAGDEQSEALIKFIQRSTDVRPEKRFADARRMLEEFLALVVVQESLEQSVDDCSSAPQEPQESSAGE
jgi:serine/threonine protein kinase